MHKMFVHRVSTTMVERVCVYHHGSCVYFLGRLSCLNIPIPLPKSIVPNVERRCFRITQSRFANNESPLLLRRHTLYTNFFGSVKEEMSSTFKEETYYRHYNSCCFSQSAFSYCFAEICIFGVSGCISRQGSEPCNQ